MGVDVGTSVGGSVGVRIDVGGVVVVGAATEAPPYRVVGSCGALAGTGAPKTAAASTSDMTIRVSRLYLRSNAGRTLRSCHELGDRLSP
jgi:hypothetical protein